MVETAEETSGVLDRFRFLWVLHRRCCRLAHALAEWPPCQLTEALDSNELCRLETGDARGWIRG